MFLLVCTGFHHSPNTQPDDEPQVQLLQNLSSHRLAGVPYVRVLLVESFVLFQCMLITVCTRSYVSTETLEFEVYGREEETDSRPTTAMPGSAYANVLLKSKSAKGLFSPDSQLSTVSEQPVSNCQHTLYRACEGFSLHICFPRLRSQSVGADVFNVEDDQKAKEEENQVR